MNRTHNVANELTAISTTTGTSWPNPAEDANGNMTTFPQPSSLGNSYTGKYDAWNRLVEIKNGGTTVSTYVYDPKSRRTTKINSGTTRHYYYSDQWQIFEERLGSSSNADRQFVWGIRYTDDLIIRDRDTTGGGTLNERLYVLQDYYQPTAVVNTSGTVLERYGYDGFGASRIMDSSFGARTSSSYDWETLFGAYRWDSETALYQVRNRYYHGQLGRWATRDPLGEDGGLNLYAYVHNNSLNQIDPFGLSDLNAPPATACPAPSCKLMRPLPDWLKPGYKSMQPIDGPSTIDLNAPQKVLCSQECIGGGSKIENWEYLGHESVDACAGHETYFTSLEAIGLGGIGLAAGTKFGGFAGGAIASAAIGGFLLGDQIGARIYCKQLVCPR